MNENKIFHGDSIQILKTFEENSIHLIASDIPYGIGYEKWDVLHDNKNSAYLGSSPAQQKSGNIFSRRGKPLNGWSEEDRLIAKQYYDWVTTWATEWLRVLKPGASAFVFAGRRLSPRCVCAFEDAGFTFKDMLGWNKERAAHRAQRVSVVYNYRGDIDSEKKWLGWKLGNLRPIFEPILWFQKPYKIGGTLADNLIENEVGAYNESVFMNYGLQPNNIINMPAEKTDRGLHPTQKPLRLMELLIELTTKENQLVLDPFCGSGTTLAAAFSTNRKYIGIEKDEDYYNIAKLRLNEMQTELVQQELF